MYNAQELAKLTKRKNAHTGETFANEGLCRVCTKRPRLWSCQLRCARGSRTILLDEYIGGVFHHCLSSGLITCPTGGHKAKAQADEKLDTKYERGSDELVFNEDIRP